MIKTLFAAALIAASTSAFAQTIESCSLLTWNYPQQDIPLIDGFNVYVNGAKVGTVLSSQQSIACSAIGLDQAGVFIVTATAYNAVGESPESDPLSVSVVTTPPIAPTGITVN